MSTRRVARGLGVLALAVPLSGAGLLLTAGPAFAAGGRITSPGDGTPYDEPARITIAATMDRNSGSGQLRVTGPNGGTDTVATASTTLTDGASLSSSFETVNCSLDQACAGNSIAPNGTWRVTLVSGSSVLDSSTFTLRVAPREPGGVSARADGYRAVVLSWNKGSEPDLTGWTVYADGNASQDIGTDACNGSSCSTTITYAEDGTGQHTYSVVAHRKVSPSSSDTLDSPQSPQASATLDSPPPPPPPADEGGSTGGGSTGSDPSGGSTGDSTGGSTGGSSGGSSGDASTGGSSTGGSAGTGGSTGSGTGAGGTSTGNGSPAIGSSKAPATLASRRAFALTFKAFAPKLGIPKLPPLPAAPSVAPLPDGTYEETLGYGDQEVVTSEKVNTPQAAARRVTGVVTGALDSEQFARFIAGALVLFLLAAHARRWLGSHTED